MKLVVDKDIPTELYLQVAAKIRADIEKGIPEADTPLPSASALARDVGVSAATVLRAFRLLRAEGLIGFTRGSRVRIAVDDRGRLRSMTAAAVRQLLALTENDLRYDAIGSLYDRADVDVLADVVRSATDRDTLMRIPYVLAHRSRRDSHRASQEILALLDHPDDGIRAEAAAALDHIASAEGPASVFATAPDACRRLREAARREKSPVAREEIAAALLALGCQ